MRRAGRAILLSTLFLLLAVPLAAAADPAAGTCTTNEQCTKDEFCSRLFGSCTAAGKCEARPEDCTERGKLLVKPVCGCDDRTYDNYCLAAKAGVSVKSEGKCAPAPGGAGR
jgi:hypothetical protein